MGGSSYSRWQLAKGVEFLTREWEGVIVLYHGGSGDTHLLEGNAAWVYKALQNKHASTEELLAALSSEIAVDDADLLPQLRHTLSALQRLDIVEPVSL